MFVIDSTQSRYPTEAEVLKAMQDLKLDRMQAYNHVKGRILLREMNDRKKM